MKVGVPAGELFADLNDTETRVLVQLMVRINQAGECWPSMDTLAPRPCPSLPASQPLAVSVGNPVTRKVQKNTIHSTDQAAIVKDCLRRGRT